ncbi:uncharacterized protein METZ01_LOCUS142650, partial [marine metagenome]
VGVEKVGGMIQAKKSRRLAAAKE